MDIMSLIAGPAGGALGLAGSLFQKWLSMKEARDNHAMKMQELELSSKIDLQKIEAQFKVVSEEKANDNFKAAIESQSELKPTGITANILSLFRPGLTAYLLLSSTILALTFKDQKPELIELVITSMFTMSSVALGYWFGVRTNDKILLNKK